MRGKNVFHEPSNFSRVAAVESSAATTAEACVFISHRKADKANARELAEDLLKAGVTIYFDENDECLKGSDEKSDPARVVRCIDAGLRRCTHLLGLITPNTHGSWWVPYEIGATRAVKKECAFLIHKNVDVVPAYVTVAKVLPDRSSLREWVRSFPTKTSFSISERYIRAMENSSAFSLSPSFVSETRDIASVKFEP